MRRTRRRREEKKADGKEVGLKEKKEEERIVGGLGTSRVLCFLGTLSYGFVLLAEEMWTACPCYSRCGPS